MEVKRFDSLTQDYTSFNNDSSVYIIGDTLITEVFDVFQGSFLSLPFTNCARKKHRNMFLREA
jgi:hypothetical protein